MRKSLRISSCLAAASSWLSRSSSSLTSTMNSSAAAPRRQLRSPRLPCADRVRGRTLPRVLVCALEDGRQRAVSANGLPKESELLLVRERRRRLGRGAGRHRVAPVRALDEVLVVVEQQLARACVQVDLPDGGGRGGGGAIGVARARAQELRALLVALVLVLQRRVHVHLAAASAHARARAACQRRPGRRPATRLSRLTNERRREGGDGGVAAGADAAVGAVAEAGVGVACWGDEGVAAGVTACAAAQLGAPSASHPRAVACRNACVSYFSAAKCAFSLTAASLRVSAAAARVCEQRQRAPARAKGPARTSRPDAGGSRAGHPRRARAQAPRIGW